MIRSFLLAMVLMMGSAAGVAKPLDGWIYIKSDRGAKYYIRFIKNTPGDPRVIAAIRLVDKVDDIQRPYLFDCAARTMGPLKNKLSLQVEELSEVTSGTNGESWFRAACMTEVSGNKAGQWIYLTSYKDLKYFMRVIRKEQGGNLAIAEIKITEPKSETLHRTLFDCVNKRFGVLKTGSSSSVHEWREASEGSPPGKWLFEACL